ncbi:MAG: thioredoxin family protein [Balneolales bacterium]|nr:thioredoxin family protein [Balneolales bacterium]
MKQTILVAEEISGEMSYDTYREMTDALLAAGKTTGSNHSEMMINYTKMNVTRMKRIDKHIALNTELAGFAAALERPQRWVVLTEPWCGDAAQILPVFNKVAEASNGYIELVLLLRDHHEELMNRYLTNGGKSIPKLIVSDRETGEELFNWGPRPAAAQKLFLELKTAQAPFTELAEKLHKWYADDKTASTQAELLRFLMMFTSEP